MPTLTQNMVVESAALLPPLIWRGLMDEDGNTDPFAEAFPLAYRDAFLIKWDQKGDPYGLLPQAALDSPPVLMQMPGIQTFEMVPGVYRGYTQIKESDLTVQREPGTMAEPINVPNRLSDVMLYFSEMFGNRLFKAYADLGVNGQINNVSTDGVQHTYQIQNYQKLSVSAWLSSPTTATPIDDLRAAATSLNKGTSTRFGMKSKLMMTDEAVNALLATSQIRNSFRSAYGASFLAPYDNAQKNGAQPPINGDQSLNKLFIGMGLPEIIPWNNGYYPGFTDVTSAAYPNKSLFTKFLPNTSAVWIGYRPKKQQLGQMTLCRHIGIEQGGTSEANYDVIGVDNESSIAGEFGGIGKGIYVKVHYNNRQPNGYDFEFGANFGPEVWYADAMASINWS